MWLWLFTGAGVFVCETAGLKTGTLSMYSELDISYSCPLFDAELVSTEIASDPEDDVTVETNSDSNTDPDSDS